MHGQLDGTPAVMRLDVDRGVGMMGSEAALRKTLVTVMVSMSADVPAIDLALRQGDVSHANRMLHAIKGYMPIFGTDALVEQVSAVESLSKTHAADAVQAPYQQLREELEGLLTDIQWYLNTGR